ncbi:nitrilase-related carbon-nitrogen hydrolase [Pseudoalteromonas spongiae]|uniref:nitrilase-related carbon-nitrogen hydrolase n=1 Tax=Pseudoalteromonas spongiae TaxID=298657 RepID=UPI001BB213D7|nr:nitrilase-related carbon-nitrogen hydrolase [Pseudoalteromonas spongiae]
MKIRLNFYEATLKLNPHCNYRYNVELTIKNEFQSMDLYYVAACQVDQKNPLNRDEMHRNTQRMLELMEQAVNGYKPFHDIKLIVFPEFAHAVPVYESAEEILEKLAVPIPNEHTDKIAEKAKALGVYVQTGSFLEVDERWPDRVFNTTCLISPEGEILSKYRKVNPWIPFEVHSSPHDIENYPDDPLPVVETEIGNLAVATCYDWMFPEVTRELTLKGAEVLIRISAYMDPWGATQPMDWWTVINRCRAIENMSYVVAANQGAKDYPPFTWPGGSMVVDYDGRILAEASPGPGERIVVAPINIAALRSERKRRAGHSMPTHLRTELYQAQKQPIYPKHSPAQDINYDSLSSSIAKAQSVSPFIKK